MHRTLTGWAWPAVIVFAMAVLLVWDGGDHAQGAALAAFLSLLGLTVRLAAGTSQVSPSFIRTLGVASSLFAAALICLGLSALIRPAPYSTGQFAAWLQALSLGAACLMGALIGLDRVLARRVCQSLAVLGGLYGLVSLLIWQSGGATDQVRRFSATLENPNAAGCLMAMFAVFVAAWMLNLLSRAPLAKSSALKVVWLALTAAMLSAACLLTGSRASALSGALGLAALLFTIIARRDARSKRPWPLVILTAMIFAIAGAFGFVSVASRGNILDAGSGRWNGYEVFLTSSIQLPFLGHGPGSFRHVNEAALTRETVGGLWNLGAAHNAILQAAIEGGWPYAGLLVIVMAYAGYLGLRGALRSRETFGLGALVVCMVAVGCGLVDIAMNVAVIATLGLFSLGLSWGRAYASHNQ